MREGWTMKKLGEVCRYAKNQGLYSGLPYIGMEDIVPNSNETTASRLPKSVKSATFNFKSGMVLFGRLRPYLRKVIVADFDGHCSTEIFPIETSDAINPFFLRYWFALDKTIDNINGTCTGARMPRANMNEVINFDIPIPSIAEQQRIVDILDSEFEKIEQLKENVAQSLANAQALFQATLKSELSPKEGWKTGLMGDYCILSQGLAINSKTKHLIVDRSTLPLLRIKDLKDGTSAIFVNDKEFPQSTFVDVNDIIYTRTGTLGLSFTGRRGIMHNNCFKIEIDTNILNKGYYLYFISNNDFRENISKLAGRAAQPDITHKLFKEQYISYPPIQEQSEIVFKIDSLRDRCKQLEQNYKMVLEECENLKQAILKQAFSGER